MLIFVLIVIFIQLSKSQSEKCSTELHCQTCGIEDGCGWCTTSSGLSVCLNGDDKGPTINVTCSQWDYDPLDCYDQDICLHNVDCASCASTFGCGWCGTVCTLGGRNGPIDPTVVCPVWKWRTQECQDMSCENFDSCGGCTIQRNPGEGQGCGWCSAGFCSLGIADGAFIDPAKCGQWIWPNSKCEEPKCSDHKNCGECIHDSSLNCGWCEDTQKCIRGYNNISSEPCGNYRYGLCRDTCFSRGANCSNCVDDERCGWCNGVCARGNEETPLSIARTLCSPWKYETCEERNCGEVGSCGECIDQGCHWCPHHQVKCNTQFSLQCCEECNECDDPPVPDPVDSVYIIILSATGTICGVLLIVSVIYSIKVYYWNKRHFYKKLS